MSFNPLDTSTWPRVGEIVRCKRCRSTFVAELDTEPPPPELQCHVDDDVIVLRDVRERGMTSASVGVADKTSELCPNCITREELALMMHSLQQRYAGRQSN